jgi:hypothetical protein
VRERYGAGAVLVGTTTFDGTVTAAFSWGEAPRTGRASDRRSAGAMRRYPRGAGAGHGAKADLGLGVLAESADVDDAEELVGYGRVGAQWTVRHVLARAEGPPTHALDQLAELVLENLLHDLLAIGLAPGEGLGEMYRLLGFHPCGHRWGVRIDDGLDDHGPGGFEGSSQGARALGRILDGEAGRPAGLGEQCEVDGLEVI